MSKEWILLLPVVFVLVGLVLIVSGCVTTTTTLPDGTVIEEKAPDMASIAQAMTFAEQVITRLEEERATSPEEEQAALERQLAEWQFYLEALEKLANTVQSSQVKRQIGKG